MQSLLCIQLLALANVALALVALRPGRERHVSPRALIQRAAPKCESVSSIAKAKDIVQASRKELISEV